MNCVFILEPMIRKQDTKQLKIVTTAPTLLCDYKPRQIQAVCGGKTNEVCDCCYILCYNLLLFGVL